MKPGTPVKIIVGAGGYSLGLYLFYFLAPGDSAYRPATSLVPALGLLLGPAGAWAAALGNFLFDLRDEIDFGTPLGILGNFLFAYLPARVAARLPGFSARPRWSARWMIHYLYLALLGALACGTVIGFGLDGIRAAAFGQRGLRIALSNFLLAALLGWIPLFLQPWLDRRGWAVHREPFLDSPRKKIGFGMMKLGLILAFALGTLASAGLIPSLVAYTVGSTQSPAAAPVMLPAMVLFFAGVILM